MKQATSTFYAVSLSGQIPKGIRYPEEKTMLKSKTNKNKTKGKQKPTTSLLYMAHLPLESKATMETQ